MASNALQALVAALAGGGQGYLQYQKAEQEREEREEEARQRRAQFGLQQEQFGLTKRATEANILADDTRRVSGLISGQSPTYDFGKNSDLVAEARRLNIPLLDRIEQTPGGRTAPSALPGQMFGLGDKPSLGQRSPTVPPPVSAPMMSPVGGQTLGSVKDVVNRPRTLQEASRESLRQAVDSDRSLTPAQRETFKRSVLASEGDVDLPSTKSSMLGRTSGSNLVGQHDSFGAPITEADADKQYVIRRSGDGSEEYVPVVSTGATMRPSYQTLRGPKGQPTVYAVWPDGRMKFVGVKSDKAQVVVYDDIDGTRRAVTIPSSYDQSNPTEVEPGADGQRTPPPASPPATKPGGPPTPGQAPQSRVIGAPQLPAAMRTDIAELEAVKVMADQATAAGEAAQWKGIGGFGKGWVRGKLYEQAGIGRPEEATLRNILNNIFGDIAKVRGGSALTPQEVVLLKSYLPSVNTSAEQIKTNLEGVQRLLAGKLEALRMGTLEPAVKPPPGGQSTSMVPPASPPPDQSGNWQWNGTKWMPKVVKK